VPSARCLPGKAVVLTLGALSLALALVSAKSHARAKARARASDGSAVLKTPGSREVLLRGGVFRMGSDVPEVALAQSWCRSEPRGSECPSHLFADEMAAHEVIVSDFWLDRTEVTVAAYRRCVIAGVCNPPGDDATQVWNVRDDHPVTLVSWADADTYCRFRGARLPTEAEWERAARGLSGRNYPWGEVFNRKICNHGRFALESLDESDGFAELAPVATFAAGRTPEGVADLAGNVEEWVADWYAPGYPEADAVDPLGPPSGDERVIRGGGYHAARPWLRGAARHRDLPSSRRAWRGFRCARSHKKSAP
jgi:formylglycine-generating enzyme required for sulfatase activity